MQGRTRTAATVASALGACTLASQLFVPALHGGAAAPSGALRGAQVVAGTSAVGTSGMAPAIGGVALLSGLAAAHAGRRSRTEKSSRQNFNGATQPGASAPLGYFDPLGLGKTEERFNKLRISEIKHGRVAMLATLGSVVQHFAQLPGFASTPSGMGAFTDPAGAKGFGAIFLLSGLLELGPWSDEAAKEPGNYGDPAGFAREYGGWDNETRTKELNNGRLAMFGMMGQFLAEATTGKDGLTALGL